MRRTIPIWVFLVVLTATWALAQEPPAQPPAAPGNQTGDETSTEADVPTIPERKLTFDVSEETTKVSIDPKALISNTNLQQLRYVARVDLYVTHSLRNAGGKRFAAFQKLFYRGPGELNKLAAALPKQHHLSDDILTELLAQGRYLKQQQEQRREGSRTTLENVCFTFEVLAPTAERAKELSHGMLALLDYGFYWPEHRALLHELKSREKELSDWRAKLAPVEAEVGKLDKELERQAEYRDIDAELLRSLVTQQRLIAVDLAGVTARLEACGELLRETRPSSKRDRVEELKVTGEIELVGLAAKKSAIDVLVKAATAREETLKKLSNAKASQKKHELNIRGYERKVAELQTAVEMSPPVVKGDVTIRRIEWDPMESGHGQRPGASKTWWVE